MELSGSDADEDGPAGDYEGDDGIDAAELEDLRRDAAGGSPRPADSSRRKRGAGSGPRRGERRPGLAAVTLRVRQP